VTKYHQFFLVQDVSLLLFALHQNRVLESPVDIAELESVGGINLTLL